MGPLIPLFWTSDDVSLGFQSQGGSLACVLNHNSIVSSQKKMFTRIVFGHVFLVVTDLLEWFATRLTLKRSLARVLSGVNLRYKIALRNTSSINATACSHCPSHFLLPIPIFFQILWVVCRFHTAPILIPIPIFFPVSLGAVPICFRSRKENRKKKLDGQC